MPKTFYAALVAAFIGFCPVTVAEFLVTHGYKAADGPVPHVLVALSIIIGIPLCFILLIASMPDDCGDCGTR